MLDDYILGVSAAIIVTSVIVLATVLSRYSRLVQEADRSTRLAKDVWDSMNSRFSVVDGRIIDLMAKTDVLSARFGVPQATPQPHLPATSSSSQLSAQVQTAKQDGNLVLARPGASAGESTETETKVLRLLAEGPKSSAEIREGVGRSREHTARLMKALFDRGLVIRNDRNKPYVYEITESGRSYAAR